MMQIKFNDRVLPQEILVWSNSTYYISEVNINYAGAGATGRRSAVIYRQSSNLITVYERWSTDPKVGLTTTCKEINIETSIIVYSSHSHNKNLIKWSYGNLSNK